MSISERWEKTWEKNVEKTWEKTWKKRGKNPIPDTRVSWCSLDDEKKDRRMGISARTVTIWASSARRIPRNDPNFVRILAWATL